MIMIKELIKLKPLLRERFRLDWQGIHGAPHWARVRANGLRLAATTGADRKVVELFAYLHDSCRENEFHDSLHGYRASLFIADLCQQGVLNITNAQATILCDACTEHSCGFTHNNSITIMTCWDADRLDLGRVGIRPDPKQLCTAAAQDINMINWAHFRAVTNFTTL